MKESVEIVVTIKNFCISDLHETVTSILDQLNLSRLNITIFFDNLTNLPIDNEKALIRKSQCKISEHTPLKKSYFLHLDSGSVISRSFLYKGIHYLKKNSAAFVFPEYIFSRINGTATISTFCCENKLVDISKNCLIDHCKLNTSSQIRAQIVKNSCIILPTTKITFKEYLNQLKTNLPTFNSVIFCPSTITHNNPEIAPTRLTKHNAILSAVNQSISNIFHLSSKPRKHKYPTIYLDDPTKNEISRLSNHKISFKGFESANFLNLFSRSNQILENKFQDYRNICKQLTSDHYDYIIVLPWIIPGGIDLFAINYIKNIAELNPAFKLLVILTNNTYESFTKEELNFSNSIDIINLPKLVYHSKNYSTTAPDLLYSLICNLNPTYLHIISNQVGYDCILKHNDTLHRKTSLIFSSYNYLIDKTGNYLGYHVKELPQAYRPGDLVTTDNQKAKTMLIEKFGFLEQDILIHNQLYDINIAKLVSPINKDGINILWAAHIRPEKNPGILNQIASNLASRNINIDCYGIFDPDNWSNHQNPLNLKLSNLHYCGPYSNFFNDINLSKYDLFLYTSHTDGMPNVILEAALAGLPIVTSDIGGIRDKLGNHAHYIKDTHSAKEFTSNILSTLENHETSLKNARSLQKKFYSLHNKQTFQKQIEEMLNRNHNNV